MTHLLNMPDYVNFKLIQDSILYLIYVFPDWRMNVLFEGQVSQIPEEEEEEDIICLT